MISAFVNHLWQSTLFAGAAGLLVLALRNNRAQVRYWLWLIASLKFLVPFSAIVALGTYFAPATTVPAASAGFSDVVTEIGQPFVAPSVSVAAVHPTTNPVPGILLALWLCGFLSVAFRWYVRWRRIRTTVRAGRPLALATGVPVLSSPVLLEPGIFGIFRPALLLPEGIADHLTREQLNAILAHELCHVRRRDNLFAALHMLVEAIFWFHPLVWWIGARLVEERERACDEEVLRLGNEPEIYAESILKTCRFYLESPLACMSGVTGSDLKKRVVRIMTHRGTARLGRTRKLLLASFATAAIAGPLAFGLMNPPEGEAQVPAHSSGPLAFEVASVKPNKSGSRYSHDSWRRGKVIANNCRLEGFIEEAYHVQPYQISGPKWLKSKRYDIRAEASWPANPDQMRQMMQNLLRERFGLALHREKKVLPVYELLVAKNGPKLKSIGGSSHNLGSYGRRGYLDAKRATMPYLAQSLSGRLDRPVLDRTGLKGVYRFTLRYAPDVAFPSNRRAAANEMTGPSIFTALREQLGLKLVSRKAPLEILVIDHIDKVPTPN